MRNTLLVSQEWCDLVFEHRNKAYGAYQIRRQAAARYRWVALIFIGLFLLLAIVAGTLGWVVYRNVQEVVKELEHVDRLKPLKATDGFEVKRISTGRRARKVQVVKGGTTAIPTVVEEDVRSAPFGIDGLPDPATIELDHLTDLDIDHNAEQFDLPIEGAQIVKTESVEELPIFPGGMQALMQYLDKEIVYTGGAQRRKAQGEALVSFIVQTDGTLEDIKMEKSVDQALDRQIMTVVRNMPKWKPGQRDGIPVPVKISIPVVFRLQ